MSKLELLPAIHPKLKLTPRREALIAEIDRVLTWHRLLYVEANPEVWRVYLLGLMFDWSFGDAAELAERLNFSQSLSKEILSLRTQLFEVNELLLQWNIRQSSKSELHRLLEPVSLEGVLFLMARCNRENIKRSISHYLTTLRHMSPDIGGKDLIAMGLPPGPIVGEILYKVLAAKIDGHAPSALNQMALAERLIKERGLHRFS